MNLNSSFAYSRKSEPSVRLFLIIVIGFAGFNYLYYGLIKPYLFINTDFATYYSAAKVMKNGGNIYDLDPVYLYPPFFAILMQPFTVVNYSYAKVLWLLLNHVFLITSIILLFKTFKTKIFYFEVGLITFLAFNFNPIFKNLWYGQVNLFTLFLVSLAFYYFKKEKDVLSGAFLAVGTMIKLTPAFLIFYFLWKKCFKLFTWAVVFSIIILLFSILVAGTESHKIFLKDILPVLLQGRTAPSNQSFCAFFNRLFNANPYTVPFFENTVLTRILTIVTSLIMILTALYFCRGKAVRTNFRINLEFSLFIITTLPISSISWEHHMVWLLFPFIVIIHYLVMNKTNLSLMALLAISYVLTAYRYAYDYPGFKHGIFILFISTKLYGNLLLWFLFLYSIGKYNLSSLCKFKRPLVKI